MNVERKADNLPDTEPARGFERRKGLEPERGSLEEGAEKSKPMQLMTRCRSG
jgi:hypothetical protein